MPCQERTRPNVLFVDDDEMLLASTQRRLISKSVEWNLLFAESSAEALRICGVVSPNAVVTDMRMPDGDGVTLLSEIQERFPDSIRIILSGQTEKDSILHAHSVAHSILGKPCDIDILYELLQSSLELQSRLGDTQIRRIITSGPSIPISSGTIPEMLSLLRTPEVSIKRVSAIIQNDLGVYAYIMKLINSSHFGLRSKVLDIDQALLLIGAFPLRTILCGLMLANALGPTVDATLCREVLQSGFQRAQRVTQLAQQLRLPKHIHVDCYMAALFQDFGKLVLSMCSGEKYHALLEASLNDPKGLVAKEREVFQCSHAEAGAYLLSIWSFPPPVIWSVCLHEDDAISPSGSSMAVGEIVRRVSEEDSEYSLSE